MKYVFLSNCHYFFAKTDGSYAWPKGAAGDLLKQAKREIESLNAELEVAKKFHEIAIKERDLERMENRSRPAQ